MKKILLVLYSYISWFDSSRVLTLSKQHIKREMRILGFLRPFLYGSLQLLAENSGN